MWEFAVAQQVWTGPVRWMLHRVMELAWWRRHPLATGTQAFCSLAPDGIHAAPGWGTPPDTRFAWQLRTRTLATCAILHQRGVLDDPTCWLCQSAPETVEHCFLECPALAIWRERFPPLPECPTQALMLLSGMGPRGTRVIFKLALALWHRRCHTIHFLRRQRGIRFRAREVSLEGSAASSTSSSDLDLDRRPDPPQRQRRRVSMPLADFLARQATTPDQASWQAVGQALQEQTQRRMDAWHEARNAYRRAYQAGLPPEQRPSAAAPPGMTQRQRKHSRPTGSDRGQTTLLQFFTPPEQRPRPPDAGPPPDGSSSSC
jgi:hypothetical protein